MTKIVKAKKKGVKAAKQKFVVDCTNPVVDNIIDAGALETFFREKIKVDRKTGNLGARVEIVRDKAKISVTTEVPMSKRYLKYLTKKYLKKQQLRDFLRVVADAKNSYQLRYFNISNDDADED
eukprot:Platyproteum_vivax@DN4836_c0_g1_i1.p1